MTRLAQRLSFLAPLLLGISTSFAGGIDYPDAASNLRLSVGLGTRYIDTEVMSSSAWSNVSRLGLSFFGDACNMVCIYGLDLAANSPWTSRFNSVNNATATSVIPVAMENSTSLDILLFWGWKGASAGFEIGAGGQIQWIEWLTAVQQANARFRAVPKLRLAITIPVAKQTELFIAASQAFNVYGNLKCSNGAFNCFNDSGYVDVTDLTIGINYYFMHPVMKQPVYDTLNRSQPKKRSSKWSDNKSTKDNWWEHVRVVKSTQASNETNSHSEGTSVSGHQLAQSPSVKSSSLVTGQEMDNDSAEGDYF